MCVCHCSGLSRIVSNHFFFLRRKRNCLRQPFSLTRHFRKRINSTQPLCKRKGKRKKRKGKKKRKERKKCRRYLTFHSQEYPYDILTLSIKKTREKEKVTVIVIEWITSSSQVHGFLSYFCVETGRG